jgi:hypothetical protein
MRSVMNNNNVMFSWGRHGFLSCVLIALFEHFTETANHERTAIAALSGRDFVALPAFAAFSPVLQGHVDRARLP